MSEFKGKPGSAMASLIPKWAVSVKAGCSCKDWAKKMDRWGPEGCEKRRRLIVDHLVSQDEKLIPILKKAIPNTVKRAIAESLLTRSIRMAK